MPTPDRQARSAAQTYYSMFGASSPQGKWDRAAGPDSLAEAMEWWADRQDEAAIETWQASRLESEVEHDAV
jgi:hypothetical protein